MDVAVQIFIALTTQRHGVKGLTALFFSSGMLHGAMCRIGLCHRPFGSDQSLPFRLGHVYGRYLQKRPLMGFRPSTHIARSKDILCIRLRTHIGCCATPFGSPTSSSLWGRFGKDRLETDVGKTATYKHRKDRCARPIPSHWKFVFENGQSRTSIWGVPDARSETGVRYCLTCRCTTLPTASG